MQKILAKLACKNYGFECDFMTNEDEAEKIIEEFREHTIQEHFIDYPEGILMKFLMRKNRNVAR
jgi:predicted small metal-binding protein